MSELPILYSFRRCPYAIRARMALIYSGINVELREITLKDKPAEMLNFSSKGTVPVLVCSDGTVLDESYQIMRWALDIADPDDWYSFTFYEEIDTLIYVNDSNFKPSLDRYKYSDRYPEYPIKYYRTEGEVFLAFLENKLKTSSYLLNESISLADVAIFPFIRQFASVEPDWFKYSPYKNLQRWLDNFLGAKIFLEAMKKKSIWKQ
mgnify:CR=1 FL=1